MNDFRTAPAMSPKYNSLSFSSPCALGLEPTVAHGSTGRVGNEVKSVTGTLRRIGGGRGSVRALLRLLLPPTLGPRPQVLAPSRWGTDSQN